MTSFRPSVDYQLLAPLRLDGPHGGQIGGVPSVHFLLRGLLVAAAVALPAFGAWIANASQHPPVSGAAQIAAIISPSPMGVAANRLR